MNRDDAISIAVEALYEKYVTNTGSYSQRQEVENALAALETLRDVYPIGKLVLREGEGHYWLEEV